MHPNPGFGAGGIELRPQLAVGPHTTGHHQTFHAAGFERGHRLFDQHFDNRSLGGCSQVGSLGCAFGRGRGADFLTLGEHRGFEARKREVQIAAVQQGPGQLVGRRVALLGQARQAGTTRVRQAHELGRFIEGLACGIVNGFAQQLVAAHAVHPHQLRVPARDQQGDEGKFGRIGAQKRREQMALQMVHAQHRFAQRRGQCTSHARAHQQRPGQTRSSGVGHHVDVAQGAPRFGQHLTRERQHPADVVAAGQLGHHAAIGLVHLDLAVERVRQQTWHGSPGGFHQGHARLVTG